MPRIKPLLVLCAALLTVTPAASADVNSDMNQFFNKLGFASNTTQPGVWQGQAAGYAYGGSLYARTQVKNVQLISMTLPDINAGCGGIDAYLGSFSFINGEQLQRFVKQIMSNAAGYFFDLALQTTVPEIKTAKDFLQKMASDINSMNLSSCQAAQGIIGGLFPRTQVSQQKVCQDIAGESNIFADWAASRQGCTVGGKSDSVRDKASDKDKERVTKNINIMWNALSKNRMFDGNKELKEFVMTLTGSLVFGPNGEITPLSARTTDRSIIRAMMEGGTAKIYHCNDSDKCLKVVADTPVTISRDNALKSQITKLLASIQNKAVSDTPLDDKEKGFISSTTIPVFKYLVDPQMLGVSNSMIYQLRTLPMTQTILTGIAIGIFPLLVLAAVFNKLTLSVLKGYVFALMWLQSWPMLYAILNSAMTFYAKQNGAPVVLSEISQIQLKYSDLASTAGYLSMMIPPLSWMMVRGLGAGFSSVYSHFASSAISPTASAAGSVVDGNYSYGNMQTENVNGFSWSTNSTTSFGQMMYQTGSGATATQTRDGNMVMDASGAMSRLPVGINATRQIAAAQQEMAREASNRAESALHGFSSSIASAWNTLSQFGSNRGSSDSVTGGADSTMSAQDSMMASRMRSAVESYAKAHNISNEQATQELASTSTRLSGGMYADAHAEWGVKPKILGVGGGVGIRGGFKGSLDATDDDSHSASSGSRATHDARHDIDAKASKDFKEASDYFTSRKVSESGSHTDNNADSRVDQLSAALNSAKQSYDQYTTNMTRSHEYAEMASRTESMSGQMSEDLSQQFALYVMKHAPQDAEAILTNTSSPEIAERRRAMAWSFVQEQVQPGVDNAWRESRGDIGKGMESVPSGGGSQDIIADHQGHQAIIDQRTQDSNIRNDVKHQVDNMVTEYKGNIGDTQNSIHGEENIVDRQYSELKNNHKQEEIQQNNRYNEENKRQKLMPTPSEDALKQMVDDKKERLKGPL
ncbi:putative traG protein [Escherichia coli 1-182-04_S1_C3]|uniref:conjugal transfer pilus assembly protein TraH n=1 Tax=Escherichia coli TaxID=562 RepID=UPI00044DF806|nr:putative traG protein [Escherichia coli 1-182-04_S1_C3]